jgi:hypothetical protein
MSQSIIQIDGRSYLLASIQIPVEMLEDGSHKIHSDIYKIDFLDSINDPEMLESIRKLYGIHDTSSQKEDQPTSMMDQITRILSDEIKPRRHTQPQNSSFKKYVSHIHRKTPKQLRFSRKTRETPIHIIEDEPWGSNEQANQRPT